MSHRIPVVCYGLGTIGQHALAVAVADPRLHVVAGVDPREDLAGTQVVPGVPVFPTLDEAMSAATTSPRVAIHATGSRVHQVAPQLRELIDAGLHVSTSCEEMIFPWYAAPELAEALHESALAADVCLYGTGVNPGYVLDRLPASMALVSARPTEIRARRVVDSSTRRPQLREKTGAGLPLEEFERRAAAGTLGHVGLRESLEFLAASLGRAVEDVRHTLQPVPDADGNALGAHEEIQAQLSDGLRVSYILEIAVGSTPMIDSVEIDGDPPLRTRFAGGIAGGPATAAALANGAALAMRLPRGISAR